MAPMPVDGVDLLVGESDSLAAASVRRDAQHLGPGVLTAAPVPGVVTSASRRRMPSRASGAETPAFDAKKTLRGHPNRTRGGSDTGLVRNRVDAASSDERTMTHRLARNRRCGQAEGTGERAAQNGALCTGDGLNHSTIAAGRTCHNQTHDIPSPASRFPEHRSSKRGRYTAPGTASCALAVLQRVAPRSRHRHAVAPRSPAVETTRADRWIAKGPEPSCVWRRHATRPPAWCGRWA